MFQGKFEHTIDEKGRLAIPANFRKVVSKNPSSSGLILTLSDGCLVCYTQDLWLEKIGQISKLNHLDPNVRSFKRFFIGSAQDCGFDKAGRILIPQDLRNHANLEKNCIILGQIDKFELWSQDKWEQNFAEVTHKIGDIYGDLAQHGIEL